MSTKTYTKEMLREFDRLTLATSSRDQVTRIAARADLSKFIEKHGKDACNDMYRELEGKHHK